MFREWSPWLYERVKMSLVFIIFIPWDCFPTNPFTNLEPQDQEISKLSIVQERCATILKLQYCERVRRALGANVFDLKYNMCLYFIFQSALKPWSWSQGILLNVLEKIYGWSAEEAEQKYLHSRCVDERNGKKCPSLDLSRRHFQHIFPKF